MCRNRYLSIDYTPVIHAHSKEVWFALIEASFKKISPLRYMERYGWQILLQSWHIRYHLKALIELNPTIQVPLKSDDQARRNRESELHWTWRNFLKSTNISLTQFLTAGSSERGGVCFIRKKIKFSFEWAKICQDWRKSCRYMPQLHIDFEDLQDIFKQSHFQENKHIYSRNPHTLFFLFTQVWRKYSYLTKSSCF